MKRSIMLFSILTVLATSLLMVSCSQEPTSTPDEQITPATTQEQDTQTPDEQTTPAATQEQDTQLPASSDGEVYTLTYGQQNFTDGEHLHFSPATDIFKDMVYEASSGRLIIETKLDLVPDNEVPMAVIDGRLDMGNFMANWSSGTFPLWDFNLPYLFDNPFQYIEAVNDPEMVEILRESYAEKGLYYFGEGLLQGNGISNA